MDMAREAEALVRRLRPVLAGHPPEVQSAALADCVAIWLAGNVTEEPAETHRLRQVLLLDFIGLVRKLIEPNAKAIGTWEC